MWIKELYLQRYGPLLPCHYRFRPGLNLVVGENDRGKTLTVEALLKLFFSGRRDRACFSNLERVEESPVGYAVIEDTQTRENPEIVVDGSTDLSRWNDLTARDYRELFVVKDGDVSLSEEEAQFYTNLTDRLTGLRTEQIRTVVAKLQDLAWLTPEGRFRNQQQFKLKEKIDAVPQLLEQIEYLLQEMDHQGYDSLRAELVCREGEAETLRQELQELEDARRRENYEVASRALQDWRWARKRRDELAALNEDDLEQWRETERSVTALRAQSKRLQQQVSERKVTAQEVRRERQRLERELQGLEPTRRRLGETVWPQVQAAREESEKLRAREVQAQRQKGLAWTATSLLALSLLGMLLASALFLPLTLFFLAMAVLLWRPHLARARAAARLEGLWRRLHLEVAPYGLAAADLESLSQNLQGFMDEYEGKRREAQAREGEENQQWQSIRQLEEEEIPKLSDQIGDQEKVLANLRAKSGVDTLEDYRTLLREKQEQESLLVQKRELLVHALGDPGKAGAESPAEEEEVFARYLAEWEPYRDRGTGVPAYDEARRRRCQSRQQELDLEIASYREQLEQWENALDGLQRQATQYFYDVWEEGFPPLRTPADLQALERWLEQWRRDWENQRRAAGRAQEIFYSLLQDEQAQVERLFGPKSEVSRCFCRVTGGLFPEARFDSEHGQVWCVRRDGVWLPAESLSGGSFDQLYFAIRLALGRELLQGRPGFFLVDDPFLRADRQRLRRQMEALLRIAAEGWQVVYFSAKEETREALAPEIESGEVNLEQLVGVTGA